MHNLQSAILGTSSRPRLYIKPGDWTWWAWAITAVLLAIGIAGHDPAFIAAMCVTVVQAVLLLVRDRSPLSFPIQLRAAYLLLLIICYVPQMRWLYWLPTIGTFALVIFGYCLMARCLSLLPWNNSEPYSLARLGRTFFSPPDLRRIQSTPAAGCAGGLCTIEAQIAPAPAKA